MLIRGAHIWTGSVLLHDAAVLIEEGTIREVGFWKELRARHPSVPVYGGDSVGHLDRMGALHRRTSLVHGVYLSESELEQMAASGASLITNPGSNLRLRCGVSPVLSALAKGVVVALGTDGMTLGDIDDALAEIRLLHHLQRTPGIDAPALTWEQSFAAATTSAAAVTPWAERVGRIAPGMVADLTLFDYEEVVGPWVHPRIHPLEVLLHRGAARHLEAVMADGEWVWTREEGTTRVSAAAVREELREHMESLDRPTPSGLTAKVEDYYRSWPI